MRSKFFKSLALAVLALVVLSAPIMPAASAQPGDSYVPIVPQPVNCTDVPDPTLALDGADVIVTYPAIYLQCVVRVVIEVDSIVLYDGPPTAVLLHRLPLPPLSPGDHAITATATTVAGVDKIASLALSADLVTALNTLIVAAGGGSFQNPSVPAPGFAVTGSNVNLPIAIGAALVGAGGIALLVARRRGHGVLA